MTPSKKSFGTHAFVEWWLQNSPRFWRTLTYCLSGGVAVALVTFSCFRLRLNLATPALLYLIVVVLLSLRGSFVLSAAFSLIGVACLAYYFAPPIFSFGVDDAFNVVAIVAFLTASAVITRLVSRLKETMERQFEMRLEERVNERTRIARDLHDTLLQSFQGLLLRFQTVYELLLTRPADARNMLAGAIDQTAQAITDGREAVQGLRASTLETNDLAPAIRLLGDELAAQAGGHTPVGLRVAVEGTVRPLQPIARDEIYRIASEALRNAFRHAEARQIEVEFRYDERQFRLRIRDDGKGIDPNSLTAEERVGHFGFHGMRERAKLIGGKLTVWTAPGTGMEVELSVPAVHAYTASSAAGRHDSAVSWESTEGHANVPAGGPTFAVARAIPESSTDGFPMTDPKGESAGERRFRLVVEAAPNAMVMIDPAGKIVMVNTQAERVFGYSRSELVGQPVELLVPERFRNHHPELRRTFLADPQPRPMGAGRELYGLKKDGSEFPVEIGLNPIEIDEGTMVLSAVVDITERKAAELALRDSEQQLGSLLNGVIDYAIYMLDPNGIITNWNQGAQRIKGYRTEEIVGRHFSCFYTEEDRAANLPQQALEIAARDSRYEAEAWRVRKDGSRFLADVVIDALKGDGGRLIGFAKITRDITERVRAARELEEARIGLVQSRAEEVLRRAQVELAHVARVTTLGELTASIAHEVTQPLAALMCSGAACLNWLDHQPPNIEKARRSVEEIIKGGTRAAEVIQRVRALANKTDVRMAPLDINRVINESIVLVQPELASHGVSLRMDLAPALPLVLADRVQLQQVIINLVMNGMEAMQPVTDRPRELMIRSHQDEAPQVLVTVEDCGVGISVENVNRLFNAFFTTKASGMGMGLSICRSIIEAHEGQISAFNNTGSGATFQFTLPSHEADSS